MELTPNDMKKLCLVRPRVATPKTTNKPHIFLHSLEQSKEAKQRKRDRWRRGASSLLPPPSPGGGPLGPSPTLLSSRSLTRPRASRPPSSKAYDYRIVDHTVICHAAAVASPFLRLGTLLCGSRSQSHRRADATPEENRLGSRRARANGRRTSSVSGGTHSARPRGMVELSPQIPNRIERRPIRTARHHETKSNALNMEYDTTILGRRCLSVNLAMAEE